MSDLSLASLALPHTLVARSPRAVAEQFGLRQDRVVVLILIAIALIIAAGLAVAWWAACQNKGMYPALDMPSWNAGGTWKAYCKK